MYYRRKIILSLLEVFGGRLKKTDFQKLLMLLASQQQKPSFEFVPYKFGCFSFQSYADMRTMIKYEQVKELKSEFESHWIKASSEIFFSKLKKEDQSLLKALKDKFSDYSTEELIKYTYLKFPYYAIKSSIAKKILNKKELEEVEKFVSKNEIKALYTIGYEGITVENYLNRLLKNNVKVLCDVRRNSRSMKYGFSKNQLLSSCEGLGIKYFHIPEVGIASEKRRSLKSQSDYDCLFEEYNNDLGNENCQIGICKILELLENYDRVAITCFEANINQCHRKHLAINMLQENEKFELIHI